MICVAKCRILCQAPNFAAEIASAMADTRVSKLLIMKVDIEGRGQSWYSIADGLKSADSDAGFVSLTAAYKMPRRTEFEEVYVPCMPKKMYESFANNDVAGCGGNAKESVDLAVGRSLNNTKEDAGKRC